MKKLLLLAVLAAALTACKNKEDKPAEPLPTPTPIVVDPTPIPTVIPPTPEPSPVYCSPQGNAFYAGNPIWYGFKKCSASADGDMYFKDYQAIVDLFASGKMGLCLDVKFKDGSVKRVPQPNIVPGPCAGAVEL